jgi:2-polyprenyl-6-methoxyphenol hydroxylase-like FAD-dependent oxidoreductase
MRALVVGGGIAGLSTAIGLRRAGVDVTVFERARELEEIGAGLSLWSNAMQALERLGVADAVRERGAIARRVRSLTPRGDIVSDVALDGFPAVSAGVHRADLQSALAEALGLDALRLGATCVGFTDEGDGVVARFEGGGDERGDVLIGADGLNSTVRRQLLAHERPRYAGFVGWRAVTSRDERLVEAGTWSQTTGRGVLFGVIDIGRGRLYWFVSEARPETDGERPPGRKRAILELVRGWHDPVEAIVEGTDEAAIFRTNIYDRKPVKRWSAGRVTLVGDAAHVMTPVLGQGAAQAIEDAVVLAECVGGERDVAAALRRYEERRRRRANGLVRQSRQLGRVFHLRNPVACRLRDAAMKATPERLGRARLIRMVTFAS